MTFLARHLYAKPRTWQHLFVVFAVAVLSLTLSYAASSRAVEAYTVDASWVSLTSDDGGFSIRAPGYPLPSTSGSVLDGGRAHFYELNKPGVNFGVGYADSYVVGMTPEQQLDAWRNNAVGSLHGTLLSERTVSMDGYPGRHVTVRMPDGKGVLHGRVFQADYRLYLIMAITANAKPSREATRFLDSFRLVE